MDAGMRVIRSILVVVVPVSALAALVGVLSSVVAAAPN